MKMLCIDIGTSVLKTALFKTDGMCDAFASLRLPKGAVVVPEDWLSALETCLDKLSFDVPAFQEDLDAVVICGNGPTLVPVGTKAPAGTQSIGSVRLWSEHQAVSEAETISKLLGEYVDPSFFLPKALFIKNHEAELYEKTAYFLYAPEYLAWVLSGTARTVLPSEGFERWYWNDDLLQCLGLDAEKFPPFVSPGEIIGEVNDERFGLKAGTKVIAAGPDFFAAILGAGVSETGQACDRSGSSGGINLCCAERIEDKRLMCYRHPVQPWWNLSGIVNTSGRALSWVKKLLDLDKMPYDFFYNMATYAAPGVGGLVFLPYLAGERAPLWDASARGVFVGLSLDTGRPELIRAAAEGVCFALKDVLETMQENGVSARELRATGGPSQSAFLNQLKADISGLPVLICGPKQAEGIPVELLGLAIIGATGLGAYQNFGEAAGAMVQVQKRFEPGLEQRALYDDLFGIYRECYKALKSPFAALEQLRKA
jgi:xylulokinase